MAMLTFWKVDMGETACMLPSPKTSAQFLWHTFIRFLKWYSLSGLNAFKEKPMAMNRCLMPLSKLILIIVLAEHWLTVKDLAKNKAEYKPPAPTSQFSTYKAFWSLYIFNKHMSQSSLKQRTELKVSVLKNKQQSDKKVIYSFLNC